MGLQINTNIAALNSYRNLSNTQGATQTSLERLSSGLRINRAADDAAGLAISEKLRGQVSGLNQAARNAQDGISLVQTAEGALDEVHSMLQRMRTLAVQSANGTNSTTNLSQIQSEVTALNSEIDAIGKRTKFNGLDVFTTAAFTLQVGANSSDTMTFGTSALTSATLTINALSMTTAGAAIDAIDKAIDAVATTRSSLGAVQNRLDHAIKSLGVSSENLAASESRIRDADMAKEMTQFSRNQILQQAGISMLAQANQAPQSVLKLLG
ncbi:flagellin [Austwickia chelonae]|uniref:flagellin N-terminal helical domain-containing protein n=1 Tax=Austwickia chelonae TaxID=100225 RepID=UPI000E277B2F|nr:flagellin [Austwickia chelonae]